MASYARSRLDDAARSALLGVLQLLAGSACGGDSDASSTDPEAGSTDSDTVFSIVADAAVAAAHPDFFATARVARSATIAVPSEGDLWPSCWSDDDNLYAAWGDGRGFDLSRPTISDIGVARISGSPRDGSLRGENLAEGDAVGQVWSGVAYNRKPTGMACIDGDLYLAVQDLALDFNDAPAATIARSRDKGRTWEWDRSEPMFRDHVLTTLFFLDTGKDDGTTRSPYVYVYALDGNWRRSYAARVADPTKLMLARVPRDALQERARWQWFAGRDSSGAPIFSDDASARVPVLEERRRIYQATTADFGAHVSDLSLLSQGGVVYDGPLRRYLYTSWTEYTFEFYEAPAPWGPFHPFLSQDFGGYPWSADSAGGYATTIPSKYISKDGRSMLVQANTFVGGISFYGFSLRELVVAPRDLTPARNQPGEPIPTRMKDGAVPVARRFRLGRDALIGDGIVTGQSEDSFSGELKLRDFWGYTWPRLYRVNHVRYTTGSDASGCGPFETLGLEVRHTGSWRAIATTPSVTSAGSASGAYQQYTFAFATHSVDGVRVVGTPRGSRGCTSIAELSVRYEARAP